jgi:hypothetical protein
MAQYESIIQQLEEQRNRIDQAIQSLRGLNNTSQVRGSQAAKTRHMSAAARARIGDAQRKRWAKWKKAQRAA